MKSSIDETKRRRRAVTIVTLYPVVVLLVSVALNVFAFGVKPNVVGLPSVEAMRALAIAAGLLALNHTWLMTATELTRGRFKMHATPEEWAEAGTSPDDAPREGVRELERHHNAHRNTTENTVHFGLLAVVFSLASPTPAAAQAWIIGFAVARLGYTYSYLRGHDGTRGLFMTLGLLAMYGMASSLVLSLFW
ncbi:MAG: MAPEG family protein [Nannocystales bacterium]